MTSRVQELDAELAAAGVGVTVGAPETCRILRIQRRTLGRLLESRAITACRIALRGSSRILIRRREIARFLAQLES